MFGHFLVQTGKILKRMELMENQAVADRKTWDKRFSKANKQWDKRMVESEARWDKRIG